MQPHRLPAGPCLWRRFSEIPDQYKNAKRGTYEWRCFRTNYCVFAQSIKDLAGRDARVKKLIKWSKEQLRAATHWPAQALDQANTQFLKEYFGQKIDTKHKVLSNYFYHWLVQCVLHDALGMDLSHKDCSDRYVTDVRAGDICEYLFGVICVDHQEWEVLANLFYFHKKWQVESYEDEKSKERVWGPYKKQM